MTEQPDMMPWARSGWLDEVSRWIDLELERHGIGASGPIEQPHSYPWSTVLRVPTASGSVYFKAVSPVDPHEPALLAALARWRPHCVPEILSVDTIHGWVLMRDAGRMLRERIRPTKDMRPWLPVLPLYAELQIAHAERVSQLLALGVPDRRLSVLPGLYGPLLADDEVLRVGLPDGLSPEEHRALLSLSPRVVELCERLAGYGIPETLNHGDLTDGNVLLRDGRTAFIDWGDACVSHPFYSLRTVLV
ncbi:MAG: aminoglycoside phosphotransferase family protein, partial [Chloroflexota bacterium]|nr:aminoglycoside phosphotransferase family protein [Chloroflexota bacterium]